MTVDKKLNIYFTAGIPALDDTTTIAQLVQNSGADMMEVGIPYSDPVADGPIIQQAHEIALANGMSIETLFTQLAEIKDTVTIPKILMGYINPVLQFGFENFCRRCAETGVSGMILPDLPPVEFERKYRKIVQEFDLTFIFLVTPETSDERILYLDSLSSGFLYAVSSSSTTGSGSAKFDNAEYLERLGSLPLKNPVMVGFGIKNAEDFNQATEHAAGGIIGSAFVKILLEDQKWKATAVDFVQDIRPMAKRG